MAEFPQPWYGPSENAPKRIHSPHKKPIKTLNFFFDENFVNFLKQS